MRIVVVEDEVLVRRGIVSGIPWGEHGIEVVGDAADGRTGLELVLRLKPDMVITDIQMPIMNGLEMIRQIRKLLPDTIVMILSVREDFSAVQEAIRLGVIDYVHKLTMSPEELIESVIQAKILRGDRGNPAATAVSGIAQEPEHSLIDWLEGNDSDYKVEPHVDINLPIATDTAPLKYKYGVGIIRLPKNASPSLAKQLLAATEEPSLQSATVQHLEENCVFLAIIDSRQQDNQAMDNWRTRLTASLRSIDIQGQGISIGLSSLFDDQQLRVEAYQQAAAALEYRFYTGPGYVHVYDVFPAQEASDNALTFIPPVALKEYLAALEQPEEALARARFEQLFPTQVPRGISPQLIRDRMMQWQSAIMMLLDDWDLPVQELWQESSPFDQIYRLETYPELREWCFRLHTVARELWTDVSLGSRRSDIEQAIFYMKENYNKPLRLQDVAATVNLSDSYFSYLFSRNTGKTFIHYLQELRVHKAKELLREGSLPWFVIGERVGFENPKYFSKIFKRYTELTPARFNRTK
jgi:two-component system response regulator YesN